MPHRAASQAQSQRDGLNGHRIHRAPPPHRPELEFLPVRRRDHTIGCFLQLNVRARMDLGCSAAPYRRRKHDSG